jgi:PA14 domain
MPCLNLSLGLILTSLLICEKTLAQEIEHAALKPGLVAAYRDSGKPSMEATLLEPTIALNLAAGEAPHPRLSADGGTYRWTGYLRVLRNGEYRFAATLRGSFRLKIGGKEVFAAESTAAERTYKESEPLTLKAGIQPLEAEFARPQGAARLELLWKGPQFRVEPLPFDVLGHLPAQEMPAFKADLEHEHGRFLIEEHGCIRCHRPAADDAMGKSLVDRPGPDLSKVGERIYAGRIDR